MELGCCLDGAFQSSAGSSAAYRSTIRNTADRARRQRTNAKRRFKRFDAAHCFAGELGHNQACHPVGTKRRSEIAIFQGPVRKLADRNARDISVLKTCGRCSYANDHDSGSEVVSRPADLIRSRKSPSIKAAASPSTSVRADRGSVPDNQRRPFAS